MTLGRPVRAALAALVLALPGTATAAATLQAVAGEVHAGASVHTLLPAREGQRLPAGRTVRTGPGAQAVLVFDDGQRIRLGERTELRIADWRFTHEGRDDRSSIELARGTARVTTGTVAARHPMGWSLATPHATIRVRGTQFVAAVAERTFVRVLEGALTLGNGGGTAAQHHAPSTHSP